VAYSIIKNSPSYHHKLIHISIVLSYLIAKIRNKLITSKCLKDFLYSTEVTHLLTYSLRTFRFLVLVNRSRNYRISYIKFIIIYIIYNIYNNKFYYYRLYKVENTDVLSE